MSLVRTGADSRAARWFRALTEHDAAGAHVPADPVSALADALGLSRAERRQRLTKARRTAVRALRAARASNTTVLSVLDRAYPDQLRHIIDPPIVLWVRGDVAVLTRPAVALVGSRRATPGGLALARVLGRDLARAGLVVVSGLARGVDGMAHRGALEGDGCTVAVLGSGLDVIYPSEHEPLAADVAGHGALVSEYPPGTRPWPGNFPLRNRVISGLSRAVVIVEASNRSGSLITARMALEQGRQVLAVPGSVGSGCYQGCHALIKDGAGLVETVEDILDEVAGVGMHGLRPVKLLETHDLSSVIREGEAVGAEELAARTGRPVEQVLAELGRLEVDGLVSRGPGGTFIRSLTDLLPIDRGRT